MTIGNAEDDGAEAGEKDDAGSTRVLPRPSVISGAPLQAEAESAQDADGASTAPEASDEDASTDPAATTGRGDGAREPDADAGDEARAGDEASRASDTAETDADAPLELSDADAERFAASIRPSWAPAMPAASAPPAAPRSDSATGDEEAARDADRSDGVATSPVREDAISLEAIPGRHQRRSQLLVAGAVVSVALLIALMFTAGGLEPSPAESTDATSDGTTPGGEVPAPAEPSPATNAEPPSATAAAPEQPEAEHLAAPGGEAAGDEAAGDEAEAAADPAAAEDATGAPTDDVLPAVGAAAPDAPLTEPEPRPEPEPQPAPLARLRVTVSPRAARLTLDGEVVEHPYDARLERGGAHKLEASAPGYLTRDLEVQLDDDRRLTLRLERDPAAKEATRARARKSRAQRKAATATPPSKASTAKGAGFVSDSPY